MFMRRVSADPDNKLPPSGYIKPGRRAETGVPTFARVNGTRVERVEIDRRDTSEKATRKTRRTQETRRWPMSISIKTTSV